MRVKFNSGLRSGLHFVGHLQSPSFMTSCYVIVTSVGVCDCKCETTRIMCYVLNISALFRFPSVYDTVHLQNTRYKKLPS